MESCYAQVDGVAVHYWRAGSGPALVMVHGLVADGRNWELNIPALARIRTVYAIDMVNMGRSAYQPHAEATLAALGDWLARLFDALGLVAADVMGSSHGGAVCLSFAVRHPARVKSMMLFGAANPFCQRPRPLIRFWTSWPGRLAARTLPLLPRFVVDQAHKRAYANPRNAPNCMLDSYCDGLNQRSINHVLRIVQSWWKDMAELERRLPEITGIPILLVMGEQDCIVSVGSALRLQEALGAQFLMFPATGHLPFVEDVAGANRAMVDWLQAGS